MDTVEKLLVDQSPVPPESPEECAVPENPLAFYPTDAYGNPLPPEIKMSDSEKEKLLRDMFHGSRAAQQRLLQFAKTDELALFRTRAHYSWKYRNSALTTLVKVGLMPRADAAGLRLLFNLVEAGETLDVALRKCNLTHNRLFSLVARSAVISALFREARERARLAKIVKMEEAAMTRAVDGVEEDVFNQRTGKKIGTKRVYSDGLLTTLLKAELPEKYTDRTQVSHKGVTLNFHVDGIPGLDNLNVVDVPCKEVPDAEAKG